MSDVFEVTVEAVPRLYAEETISAMEDACAPLDTAREGEVVGFKQEILSDPDGATLLAPNHLVTRGDGGFRMVHYRGLRSVEKPRAAEMAYAFSDDPTLLGETGPGRYEMYVDPENSNHMTIFAQPDYAVIVSDEISWDRGLNWTPELVHSYVRVFLPEDGSEQTHARLLEDPDLEFINWAANWGNWSGIPLRLDLPAGSAYG
jgi:hypothetical protein